MSSGNQRYDFAVDREVGRGIKVEGRHNGFVALIPCVAGHTVEQHIARKLPPDRLKHQLSSAGWQLGSRPICPEHQRKKPHAQEKAGDDAGHRVRPALVECRPGAQGSPVADPAPSVLGSLPAAVSEGGGDQRILPEAEGDRPSPKASVVKRSNKADALAAIELRGPSGLADVAELLPDVNAGTLNGWLVSLINDGKLVRERQEGGPGGGKFIYRAAPEGIIPPRDAQPKETSVATAPPPQPTDPFHDIKALQMAVRAVNEAFDKLRDTPLNARIENGHLKVTMEIS